MSDTRILIAGGRELRPQDNDFDDSLLLLARRIPGLKSGKWITSPWDITIVHGAARGVDQTSDVWAKKRNYNRDPDPVSSAEWETIGKGAGHVRNERMVKSGIAGAIIFWDGSSKGTANTLGHIKALGNIPYVVVVSPV